jgi:hypothetical protein
MRALMTFGLVATLAGYATSTSAETASTYISPTDYRALTCPQLLEAAKAISAQAGVKQGNRSGVDISTSASPDIAWPIGKVGDDKQKLANRKSRMVALEQASIQMQCSIQFQRPPNE